MNNVDKDESITERQDIVRRNIVEQYIAQRKQHNLTQEELASIMGVTRPNISRFETGQYNPTLDLLVKMAECMDLEIEVTLVERQGGIKKNGEE